MTTRSDDSDVVTLGWLRKQALRFLLWVSPVIVVAVGFTWNLSAQNSELHRDIQDAKAAIPRIEAQLQETNAKLEILTSELRKSNKTQDSLIVWMSYQRRGALNPLSGR